jgi:hypothetical protein
LHGYLFTEGIEREEVGEVNWGLMQKFTPVDLIAIYAFNLEKAL